MNILTRLQPPIFLMNNRPIHQPLLNTLNTGYDRYLKFKAVEDTRASHIYLLNDPPSAWAMGELIILHCLYVCAVNL